MQRAKLNWKLRPIILFCIEEEKTKYARRCTNFKRKSEEKCINENIFYKVKGEK